MRRGDYFVATKREDLLAGWDRVDGLSSLSLGHVWSLVVDWDSALSEGEENGDTDDGSSTEDGTNGDTGLLGSGKTSINADWGWSTGLNWLLLNNSLGGLWGFEFRGGDVEAWDSVIESGSLDDGDISASEEALILARVVAPVFHLDGGVGALINGAGDHSGWDWVALVASLEFWNDAWDQCAEVGLAGWVCVTKKIRQYEKNLIFRQQIWQPNIR